MPKPAIALLEQVHALTRVAGGLEAAAILAELNMKGRMEEYLRQESEKINAIAKELIEFIKSST